MGTNESADIHAKSSSSCRTTCRRAQILESKVADLTRQLDQLELLLGLKMYHEEFSDKELVKMYRDAEALMRSIGTREIDSTDMIYWARRFLALTSSDLHRMKFLSGDDTPWMLLLNLVKAILHNTPWSGHSGVINAKAANYLKSSRIALSVTAHELCCRLYGCKEAHKQIPVNGDNNVDDIILAFIQKGL